MTASSSSPSGGPTRSSSERLSGQVSRKPPHVGAVHVLRHSGALERLKDTENLQALQDQLGHSTAKMTLRYMKTLTAEESVRINQQVDFRW